MTNLKKKTSQKRLKRLKMISLKSQKIRQKYKRLVLKVMMRLHLPTKILKTMSKIIYQYDSRCKAPGSNNNKR
jgi:hypothetical protein